MNITWQTATHEKITITKDNIRIKVGPDGDKHRGTLLKMAEKAYKEYIEEGVENTVRGQFNSGPNYDRISFYIERRTGKNLWRTYTFSSEQSSFDN